MERKKLIQIATVGIAILGLPTLLLFVTMGKTTPMAEKIDQFLFFYFPFFLSLMTLGIVADAIDDFVRKKYLLGTGAVLITAACLWLTFQAVSNFWAWKDYEPSKTSREENPPSTQQVAAGDLYLESISNKSWDEEKTAAAWKKAAATSGWGFTKKNPHYYTAGDNDENAPDWSLRLPLGQAKRQWAAIGKKARELARSGDSEKAADRVDTLLRTGANVANGNYNIEFYIGVKMMEEAQRVLEEFPELRRNKKLEETVRSLPDLGAVANRVNKNETALLERLSVQEVLGKNGKPKAPAWALDPHWLSKFKAEFSDYPTEELWMDKAVSELRNKGKFYEYVLVRDRAYPIGDFRNEAASLQKKLLEQDNFH